MSSGSITVEQIVAVLAIFSAIGGLWFRVESAIGKVRDDLAEYKLTAANNFAKNADISAVEIRVLGQITNVALESIDKLLREMALTRDEK